MAEQRLIDANALDFNYDRRCFSDLKEGFIQGIDEAIEIIKNAPTIDAKPVVHAHWTDEITDCWHCSNCLHPVLLNGAEEYVFSNYCPYCGAQMDEKEG